NACLRVPGVRASSHDSGPPPACGGGPLDTLSRCRLLLVATLDARALEQLAVLLLGHPLAPLLDNRAHDYPRSLLITRCLGAMGPHDLRGASLPARALRS